MRNAQQGPTIIEDIGALAELYTGLFKMMSRRLAPRPRRHKHPQLPDELLPPPMAVAAQSRTHRDPTRHERRN